MQPTPSDDTRPASHPRLGIIDLLIWMASVAVVLAMYRALTDWSEIEPKNSTAYDAGTCFLAWPTASRWADWECSRGLALVL